MPEKIVQEIPLGLIDEPSIAARSVMIAEKLEELCISFKEVGVCQPITVIPKDGRYEIEQGHRRYIAAGMAGLATIPCISRQEGDADPDARKFHENFFREAVNPVDEGRYFLRLQKERGWSVSEIARFCSRCDGFVTSRISLVSGDERILAALEAGQINFSQGVEILKAEDGNVRGELLRISIESGASVASLRLMRYDYGRVLSAQTGGGLTDAPTEKGYVQQQHLIECPSCIGNYNVNQMYPITLCKTCYDGMLAGLEEARAKGV